MTIATFILLIFVLVLLAYLVIRIVKDAPDRAELARLRTRDQDFQEASRQLQEKTAIIEKLQTEKATLIANLENERRISAEKIKLLQDSEARLKMEFENLANRIFEDKGKALTEQNRERILNIIQPFKEQLESFRKRVDEVHKDNTERSVKLLEQVRQLQELSNKISDEANNLAKAIKGDVKKQGNWGEVIVERIFETCGLERGREFDTQAFLRSEDGSGKKPDFIVYLPGDKAVIIDSKVSLTAFERFCNADNEKSKQAALAEHIRSVRKHIEELQEKNYSELLGNKTLDFVIMCIPLEPAYQLAFQADSSLIYDLAKTNVVLASPTTLMITLKVIGQIWRRERENRNAELIADRAGKMYDKVVLIIEAMTDLKSNIQKVSASFEEAMSRLKDGRGNLIAQIEDIRRLGAKVNKQLPPSFQEQSVSAE